MYPALTNRTWRYFGSETQLLKGIQPLVRESLKGLKILQRKDASCRFCIFRPCLGWARTVLVCELSIVFPGGRGIRWVEVLQCLLEPFSVTFCCVSKTHNKAFEQVSNLRCIFKKTRKKICYCLCLSKLCWLRVSGPLNAGHGIILQIVTDRGVKCPGIGILVEKFIIHAFFSYVRSKFTKALPGPISATGH